MIPVGEGRTRVELAGDFAIDGKKLKGIPSLMAGTVGRAVEGFLAKQIANFDNRAFGGDPTSKRPGARSRNLHRDLVGFQLDQRLSARHRVAFVLQPAEDRSLDDRFTQRWDLYR